STQSNLILGVDGTRNLTTPDGQVDNLAQSGDPRFGMQAPIAKSDTIATPGGLNFVINRARSVTLSDPLNPLSLTAQNDTATINGNTFTSAFSASTRQFTLTSAESRQAFRTIDSIGRVTSSQIVGLNATTYGYDTRGRLSSTSQGSAPDTRVFTLSYNPQG